MANCLLANATEVIQAEARPRNSPVSNGSFASFSELRSGATLASCKPLEQISALIAYEPNGLPWRGPNPAQCAAAELVAIVSMRYGERRRSRQADGPCNAWFGSDLGRPSRRLVGCILPSHRSVLSARVRPIWTSRPAASVHTFRSQMIGRGLSDMAVRSRFQGEGPTLRNTPRPSL
ncbi:hypothetical protein ES707_01002 [subsurface metagenome]